MVKSLENSSHNTVMVIKQNTDCNMYHATKTRQICCRKISSEEMALRPSGKCVVNAAVRLIALVQHSAADSPKKVTSTKARHCVASSGAICQAHFALCCFINDYKNQTLRCATANKEREHPSYASGLLSFPWTTLICFLCTCQ